MNRLLEAIPYARFLGIEIEPIAPSEASVSSAAEGERDAPTGGRDFHCVLPFRDEIVGNARLPAIHGGVIGAFLELTALLRLMDADGVTTVPKPINFAIDYLRSAGPRTTRAHADIFKLGRRIAHVHVVAWQDERDRPVATGNGKFLLA